ncbi:FliH/SctL family protein [Arenibaculum pallidiluteum]|uniref:FliH/SctL family protein n=1 Tax=Arenibaculum pallidiluteum TaxID=2812559 RepID=UPI001A95E70A|nr:FliH/SctL family protein [Arenibaculum pallidiluteum]
MGFPRYAFDQRFDDPPPASFLDPSAQPNPQSGPHLSVPQPAPAPEPDPGELLRYTEIDMTSAVARAELTAFSEGYERGRADAEEEAARRAEARLGDLMATLADRLAELGGKTDEIDRLREAEGAAVLGALVRQLVPRLLRQQAEETLAGLAAEALRVAGRRPEIAIHVHPDFVEPLRRRLDAGGKGSAPRVDVRPDIRLAPGAVEADWETGGLSYDPAEIERGIAALVDQACPAPAESGSTQQ